MSEFTEEQLEYIASSIDENIYLEACPGSGKTEVIAAKFRNEVEEWDRFPSGIAALSFSKSAVSELDRRIGKKYKRSSIFPHFVGTFDSFIYKNIVNPLSEYVTDFNGIDGDCSIRIVGCDADIGYRTKYSIAQSGKAYGNKYYYDIKLKKFVFDTGESSRNKRLNSCRLEEWEIKELKDVKRRMLAGGYATYRDIEYLAWKAFRVSDCDEYLKNLAKRFSLIIVDECQDLSFEQLEILQGLNNFGVNLHFVGDLHQSIYGFRDVDPLAVEMFAQKNNFNNLKMTRNFRSCQKIINVCGKLTGRSNINGQVSSLGDSCHIFQYKDCPTEVLEEFELLCEGHSECVIVSRGYSVLNKFKPTNIEITSVHKLALAIKLFKGNGSDDIASSIELLSSFIKSTLKFPVKPNTYNCPEKVSSSISWRLFLYSSLKYLSEQDLSYDTNWSSWVKNVKEIIRDLPCQAFVPEDIACEIRALKTKSMRSPNGQATDIVDATLEKLVNSKCNYRLETIHGVKGETHDVTMLVSSADGRGGGESHWKNWIKNVENEAARFSYVASSRPRHHLVWAVKELKRDEIKTLAGLGFNFNVHT